MCRIVVDYFQGNQILANVSPDEYSRIIKVLEDAILSTDLAVYFRYSITYIYDDRSGVRMRLLALWLLMDLLCQPLMMNMMADAHATLVE
jgi:hypothetical protein